MRLPAAVVAMDDPVPEPGLGGGSPSTPERAMERQLVLKAKQLELSFAGVLSDLRSDETQTVPTADGGAAVGQVEARPGTAPRDVTRPRTKAKKVQSKKFGAAA
eukprot:COSAG03_NODE_16543_length_398_cov_1.799331_1_plen_103_part_10